MCIYTYYDWQIVFIADIYQTTEKSISHYSMEAKKQHRFLFIYFLINSKIFIQGNMYKYEGLHVHAITV